MRRSKPDAKWLYQALKEWVGGREKRMRGEEQLQGDKVRGKCVTLRMPLCVRG